MTIFGARTDLQIDTPLAEQPQKIDRLLVTIGASKRGDNDQDKLSRFVEPAPGTLHRVMSKHHHVILGRRGSGKTSLLRKAEQELSGKGVPVAFIDLDLYKRQALPNLIASVLRDVFRQYRNNALRLSVDRQPAIVPRLEWTIEELEKFIAAPDNAESLLSLSHKRERNRE